MLSSDQTEICKQYSKKMCFSKKYLVLPKYYAVLSYLELSFFLSQKKIRGDIYLVQIQQMSIKTYQFSKILSMLKSHLEFFLFLQVDLERKRRCGISRENILNNIYCPAAGDSRKSENDPGFNSLPHPTEDRLASASAVCIGKSLFCIPSFSVFSKICGKLEKKIYTMKLRPKTRQMKGIIISRKNIHEKNS